MKRSRERSAQDTMFEGALADCGKEIAKQALAEEAMGGRGGFHGD